MAEIFPFRGIRYNQSLINDLSAVICPPYDIINPQAEAELRGRSKYNFIRLEMPRDTAEDKYTHAAAILERWLEQDVLKPDRKPAVYLYDHCFSCQGKEYTRRSIITSVRLEGWDKGVVRPHEGILTRPKDDRLKLLGALKANTSPILTLFEDCGRQIASVLAEAEQKQPAVTLSSADGESHSIRPVTEKRIINRISACLADWPLYIADGHHRYESALAYRRERRAAASSVSGDEPFNFVMMALTDFADPGLIVLPPHRLVRGISRADLGRLLDKLKVFFAVKTLPLNKPDVWQRVDKLLSEESDRICLALFGLAADKIHVLQLRDLTAASRMMPHFHSELYQWLDVCIVDHVILENMLGVDSDSGRQDLTYSCSRQDAVDSVLDGEYQLAFLLRPVKPKVIKAFADAGDRMPRKSTYFYPKLPSGLILRRLV
ncbi:DUF1015 domain-containing protein [Chloroflexota bacterium]